MNESSVWSRLPREKRRLILDKQLKSGQILHLYCSFTNPPKNKFLLLLGSNSPNFSFFVINSAINNFILHNNHLLECQVLIDKRNHPFLDHDSYLDCSKIYQIAIDSVKDQLVADSNPIKMSIRADIKRSILDAVRKSKTLTPKEKKDIEGAFP